MLTKTLDKAEIMAVLAHASIWPHIAPEGVQPSDFDPPLDSIYYLTADKQGLMIAHETELGMLIHANFLPEARFQAVGFAQQAVNDCLHRRDVVYSLIAPRFAHAYRFALKCGLRDGGMLNGRHFLYTNKPLGD